MDSPVVPAPIVDKILHFLPREYVFYLGLVNKFWFGECRRRVLDTRVSYLSSGLCHLWFAVGNVITPHAHYFLWPWYTSLLDHHVSVELFGSYARQLLHFAPMRGSGELLMVVPEYRRHRHRRKFDQFPLVHRAYPKEPWIVWDRLLVYRAILSTHCIVTLEKVQYLLEKIFDMRQMFVGDVVLAGICMNRMDILRWIASLSTRYAWIEPLLDRIARFVVERMQDHHPTDANLPHFAESHRPRGRLPFTQKDHCDTTLRYVCQWADRRRPIKGDKIHKWILAECVTDAEIVTHAPRFDVMTLAIRNTLNACMEWRVANSRTLYWMSRYSPDDLRLPMNLVLCRTSTHWTSNIVQLFSTFTDETTEKVLVKALLRKKFDEYGPGIISSDLDWFVKCVARVGADIHVILAKAMEGLDRVADAVLLRDLVNTQTFLMMDEMDAGRHFYDSDES